MRADNRVAESLPIFAHGESPARDTPSIRFRTDIEGLRGIAVAAVLAFHIQLGWFPGGFVGVDIFFVISGFLMTEIIGRALDAGKFSLWQFYRGRILRIWPAMFVLIAAALLLGSLSLFPSDLEKMARAAFASVLLYNNFFFAYNVGYFDGTAVNNVFLHLWSLGVEQQYYLAMPLLMLLVGRQSGKSNWRAMLIPLALAASLLLCIIATPPKPIASFYMLPTRAWEFLLGSVAAFWAAQIRLGTVAREGAAIAGLALIAIAVTCFDRGTAFPGYFALLPAGGAALIIAAGTGQPTVVSNLLSLPLLRTIGRLSYSLYLWHWPIIVFARLRGFAIDSVPVQVFVLALSFAASYVSWRYIEVAFRQGAVSRKSWLLPRMLAAAVIVAAGSFTIAATGGLSSRLDRRAYAELRYVNYPQRAALYREGPCFLPSGTPPEQYNLPACSNTGPGKINLLVWGDSLAADLTPGLLHEQQRYGVGFTQATYGACSPARVKESATCRQFTDDVMKLASDGHYDAVVLSADWAGYPGVLPKLDELVQELRRRKVTVVLVGPRMEYPGGLPNLLASREFGILPASTSTRDWLHKPSFTLDAKMKDLFSHLPGVLYFSPLSELCPRGDCPVVMKGDVPLIWDGAHLTKEGSEFFVPHLLDAIVPSLRQGVSGK